MAKKWKHNRCVTKKLWSFNLNFPTCCTTHRAFWVAKQEHRLLCVKTGLIFFNGEKIKITFANWKIEFSTEIACCKTSLEIPYFLIYLTEYFWYQWILFKVQGTLFPLLVAFSYLCLFLLRKIFWIYVYPLPINLFMEAGDGKPFWNQYVSTLWGSMVLFKSAFWITSLWIYWYFIYPHLSNFLHVILRRYLRIWKAENWVISFQGENLLYLTSYVNWRNCNVNIPRENVKASYVRSQIWY